MKKFESVIIIKPNLNKAIFNEILESVKAKIGKYAKNVQIEDIGQKTLAYEIRKNKEGHYLVFQYEIEDANISNALRDIEYFFRITDEIIKYITVKC